MAIAAVANTSAVQLDSTVKTLAVPAAVAGSNHAIVVHVAIASAVVTVASVTDSNGDTFTKQDGVTANREVDYSQGRYYKNAILDEYVRGEVWTAIAGAASATVTVTLTDGAKFAVQVQEYSGNNSTAGTAFPKHASSAQATSSAPSITIASMTSTSFLSAGFSTVFGLNQAAGANNTLRGYKTGSPNGLNNAQGIAIAVADSLVSTTATVALAPVSAESVDGVSGSPGSPSAGTVAVAVPATYAVCAVEVHV